MRRTSIPCSSIISRDIEPDKLKGTAAHVMRIALLLSTSALVAWTATAQAPAAHPGTVDGTVKNSLTGEPIRKATVHLSSNVGSNESTATTDAAGHFHFENVNPGTYSLYAMRDGFMASLWEQPVRSQIVAVGDDQQLQDVTLKLIPTGVIGGHVLDDDGDPIIGAQVVVLQYLYGAQGKRLTQVSSLQSNDLGEFEAHNLAPGRYYVQVAPPQPPAVPPHTRWSHGEQAYPTVFYPNADEIGQAMKIQLAAGAHVGNIDFRLRKMPAYHIRGTVIGGHPGAPAQVVVKAEFGVEASTARSSLNPDGSFDIRGVVNGSYQVSYQDTAIAYSSPMVRVSDADVNAVVISPVRWVDLSGAITAEGAQPEKLELQFLLWNIGTGVGGAPKSQVNADGTFTITGARPDRSQLDIRNVPAGYYVKSIRFGDQEIRNGEIDLGGGATGPLNIVLGTDPGEVDGSVQTADGQPAPQTEVTLAPVDEYEGRPDLFKTTMTDASGNFQIKDVAPGEYRVFAWANNTEASSAEFRKPFESKSVAVTVGSQEKTSVQLTVITADEIEKEMSKLP